MPVGLRGWGGAVVHTTGIVVGGFEHGFSIMDEHCPRGGQFVVTSRTENRDRLLRRLHAVGGVLGVTRMEVEAQVAITYGGAPRLLVTRYFGSSFKPMTAQQLAVFDRRRGL